VGKNVAGNNRAVERALCSIVFKAILWRSS